jgi:hypothetical protein
MILPPRHIVEPEIGDLSALNSTTMRSDRRFANLWPRASKLHRRDRTAWLSKRSALMLVIAASLRMVHELAAISLAPMGLRGVWVVAARCCAGTIELGLFPDRGHAIWLVGSSTWFGKKDELISLIGVRGGTKRQGSNL